MEDEYKIENLDKLKRFKNLYRYALYFAKNNGDSEHYMRLPNLTIWCRLTLEKNGVDVPNFFGWDDAVAEDFYSWGHNSRWNHTFGYWMEQWILDKEVIDMLEEAAIEYGDPDVYEIYPVVDENSKINLL